MNHTTWQINLALGWLWILLGFASGFWLGLHFHKEDWLGGYGSYPRRMYRLAHISFFGLAAVNLLFYFTMRSLTSPAELAQWASGLFVVGAISMPTCCVLMAWSARWRNAFAVPVLSLFGGGVLTILEIVKL